MKNMFLILVTIALSTSLISCSDTLTSERTLSSTSPTQAEEKVDPEKQSLATLINDMNKYDIDTSSYPIDASEGEPDYKSIFNTTISFPESNDAKIKAFLFKAEMDEKIRKAFERAELLRPKSYEVLETTSRYDTAYVTLKNTDKVSANFTVSFSFLVSGYGWDPVYGDFRSEINRSGVEKSICLDPGEEGTVKASAEYYEGDSGMTWSYQVWPGIVFPEN